MTKKDFIDDAMNEIHGLFSPLGCQPSQRDLRDIVRWIYEEGQEHKKVKRKVGK